MPTLVEMPYIYWTTYKEHTESALNIVREVMNFPGAATGSLPTEGEVVPIVTVAAEKPPAGDLKAWIVIDQYKMDVDEQWFRTKGTMHIEVPNGEYETAQRLSIYGNFAIRQ